MSAHACDNCGENWATHRTACRAKLYHICSGGICDVCGRTTGASTTGFVGARPAPEPLPGIAAAMAEQWGKLMKGEGMSEILTREDYAERITAVWRHQEMTLARRDILLQHDAALRAERDAARAETAEARKDGYRQGAEDARRIWQKDAEIEAQNKRLDQALTDEIYEHRDDCRALAAERDAARADADALRAENSALKEALEKCSDRARRRDPNLSWADDAEQSCRAVDDIARAALEGK